MISLQKKFSRPGEPVQLQKTISSDSFLLGITRILRVSQFVITLLVLAFTIFMLAEKIFNPVAEVFAVLILTVTIVYTFVTSLDVVTQFHGLSLPSSPMLLFSFLGILIFSIAGNLMLSVYINHLETTWYIITTSVFCFILAVLYLLDVMSFLAMKRPRDSTNPYYLQRQPAYGREPEMLYLHKDFCPPGDRCKCDFATSVSSLRHVQISSDVADHACRKLALGRRREYVDAQVSSPSLCPVDVAQNQTEPLNVSFCGVQTPRCEVKETPIQTSTHCDTCHTPFSPAPAAVPAAQTIFNPMPPSCGVCPGLIHLLQDKGQSCCNSCNCGSHHQTEQEFCEKSAQSAQTGNLALGHEGLTARLAGIPQCVTKVAMFSYVQRHKKTQTPTKNIITEEHVDFMDEFQNKESTFRINEEPTTDKNDAADNFYKASITQGLTNRNQEIPEQAETDTNAINASDIQDENDGILKSGTYRKKNKIRPVVRDSLYRN